MSSNVARFARFSRVLCGNGFSLRSVVFCASQYYIQKSFPFFLLAQHSRQYLFPLLLWQVVAGAAAPPVLLSTASGEKKQLSVPAFPRAKHYGSPRAFIVSQRVPPKKGGSLQRRHP